MKRINCIIGLCIKCSGADPFKKRTVSDPEALYLTDPDPSNLQIHGSMTILLSQYMNEN